VGELQLQHLSDALQPLLDDEDTEVRLEAAVALASLGSETGLGALGEVYTQIYRVEQAGEPDEDDDEALASIDAGLRIRAALAGLAEHGDHAALIARLKSDARLEKTDPEAAALNRQSAVALLAAIGDRAAIRGIAKSLDDSHNVVQRDAINALRQLVEEQPPFDGASIFQQINEVKRLKEVLSKTR
jgi:HEAT repeat protein